MKITSIRPILPQGERRVCVVVKIETDQPGLIGWGEASVAGKPRALAGCIQGLKPMILGNEGDKAACARYAPAFSHQGVPEMVRAYGARHKDGGLADS